METSPDKPAPPPTLPPAVTSATPRKTNWRAFWLVLFAPALLTLTRGAMGKLESDLTGYCVLYGSGIAAIICGYIAAGSFIPSNTPRALIALPLAMAFFVLSIVLCFAGCVIGNKLS